MKASNKFFKLPKRGEIWLVDFNRKQEKEESKIRPVLIISDDIQNELDKWIVGIPMTTKDIENIRLVEVFIKNTEETGLDHPSKLQFNYPRTIDKELRLIEKLGIANKEVMKKAKIA
jgi:mRNA interferase MazF